ncbi:MAG: hypothetical protein HY738_16145 [Bacteroidia bacterium]|nr:hypothetical protein [Bacteroidia bacterium]
MGIGTINPVANFQIGNIWTFSDNIYKVIGRNCKIVSYLGNAKRIENGYASMIGMDYMGGIFLGGADDGYANSDITWNLGLYVRFDGKVSIGTTIPTNIFHIESTGGDYGYNTLALIKNTGTNGAGLQLLAGGVNRDWFLNATGTDSDQGADKFVFHTDSTDVLTLKRENLLCSGGNYSKATVGKGLVLYSAVNSTHYGWMIAAQHNVGEAIEFTPSVSVVGNDPSIEPTYSTNPVMVITRNGRVGINTKTPTSELTVKGTIFAEEVKLVDVGADYVFDDKYHLISPEELERYIKENRRLPGVPPASETKEGVGLGSFTSLLLQKIEELTLYIIEQDKRIKELEKKCLNRD